MPLTSHFPRLLTMRPIEGPPGHWEPLTTADRQLLEQISMERQGDLYWARNRTGVSWLVAICTGHGVDIQFLAPRPQNGDPSPAPGAG